MEPTTLMLVSVVAVWAAVAWLGRDRSGSTHQPSPAAVDQSTVGAASGPMDQTKPGVVQADSDTGAQGQRSLDQEAEEATGTGTSQTSPAVEEAAPAEAVQTASGLGAAAQGPDKQTTAAAAEEETVAVEVRTAEWLATAGAEEATTAVELGPADSAASAPTAASSAVAAVMSELILSRQERAVPGPVLSRHLLPASPN